VVVTPSDDGTVMSGRELAVTMGLARKVATVMDFGLWLLAGVAIGMIVMAFLAIGTYQRGYDEGYRLRRPWRAELGARRLAVATASLRETAVSASSLPDPSTVPLPHSAVA
jgi:hypothetical protein